MKRPQKLVRLSDFEEAPIRWLWDSEVYPWTGTRILNMLLSVHDEGEAEIAVLVFEDYCDRRAKERGLDPNRVRRGIASCVTKKAHDRRILQLLSAAQDALVARGEAVGAARFDGTYVNPEAKGKPKAKGRSKGKV